MKNLFNKFLNPEKYLADKRLKIVEKDKKIFKEKYEKQINGVQNSLKDKDEISFLHAGHIGDIINVLPVVKEISKSHKCNLIIQTNLPAPDVYNSHPAGKFYLNKKIYDMLYPLLIKQSYIKKVELYSGQSIDINFNLIRELPINLCFDNKRYWFHIAGIQVDLSKKYLEVEDHANIRNKITICRSLRYQNPFIDYSFLEKYEDIYYIGVSKEYENLKKKIKNLKFYECKDFLEMAMIIKSSKMHIGNQTLGIDIAEGLKSPRMMEVSPYFPTTQIHGEKGYEFYFQTHFEKYFNILNNK